MQVKRKSNGKGGKSALQAEREALKADIRKGIKRYEQ